MQSSQAEVVAKKYRLGKLIYGGELSWVFEASFVNTKRKASQIPLILKTIPRSQHEQAKIEELKRRVNSEAQALASLDNPFIVKTIDYGEDSAMPYLVMRRRSMNLSQYLQANGKLSLITAIPLLHNLATALDYAHTRGCIHRDIKPDNILLDLDAAGQPLYAYITDFGIAQHQDSRASTKTNQIMGTMLYMPPERLAGRETTKLSDVYSFGLVAYEMLAGLPLFREAEAIQEQINLILTPSPELYETVKTRLDRDVARVILKAISTKPEDRYPSATEFTTSLGQLLNARNLAFVNQAIARNLQEAGRADEALLMPDEKEEFRFSLLWISVLIACLFGVGFLLAQFVWRDGGDGNPTEIVVQPNAEGSEESIQVGAPIVPTVTETASPSPSPEPSATETATATSHASNTPTITPSPSLTLTMMTTPTITQTPTNTLTPQPEVDCEGAAWIYHGANRGDTLSHYVYSLINNPAFAGMDYARREALIRRVNKDVDFDPLPIGQLVCLPGVPPVFVNAPAPTALVVDVVADTPVPNDAGSGAGDGSGNNSGNGSGNGAGNGSGNGSGGGQATQIPVPTSVPATQPPVVPTAVPINVSVSSTCANGNSGGTTFRISNNGSTSVNISWRLTEGGSQISSGNASLGAGASATAWSGNTKNKNYTLTINETGAASGESCG